MRCVSNSRRTFCQNLAGGFASLFVRPGSAAALEPAPEPTRALLPRDDDGHHFVLYSDCCSGTPGTPNARNLQLVNAIVSRISPSPEFISFPGDAIAGYTDDYAELRRQWNYWLDTEMGWLRKRNVALYQSTSNHNTYDAGSEQVFREVHSDLPQNGPLGQHRKLGETVVPGREILELETERDIRRNTIDTLRMKLEGLGAETDARLPVIAPMGGLVSHVDVVVGQHVEPTHHLFKIRDLSEVWLECEVTEDVVALVTDGQAVRFVAYAYPDRVFTGIVNNASLVVDQRERVRRVWVHVQNRDEALLPGMFGRSTMILKRAEDVFVAPKSGVVVDGAERYCFVQIKEGVYRKASVVLGAAEGDRVAVLDGAYAGDLLVTNGNHELSALFVQGVLRLYERSKKWLRNYYIAKMREAKFSAE